MERESTIGDLQIPPLAPREVWVIKGIVTDPTAYESYVDRHPELKSQLPARGDPEWRFCDSDPTGTIGSSSDYLSLEHGLADHDGCVIHFVSDPPPDATLYDRWQTMMSGYGSWRDFLVDICDAAYEQGILGTLLDGLEGLRSSRSH